jgi:DNA-binding MarR family transcriptional regulator
MAREPNPRALCDPLDSMLGYQLRRASLVTLAALGEAFEGLGLRPTEAIMIRFVEANPGCNQAEIGRALGVKRTNLVPVVAGLVEAGLIDRRSADGRTHALYLTDDGARMHQRIAKTALEVESHFFGHIDDATREVMLRALRSIREKAQ